MVTTETVMRMIRYNKTTPEEISMVNIQVICDCPYISKLEN